MLNGISFWTSDKVWAGILSDLGGVFISRGNASVIWRAPKTKISTNQIAAEFIRLQDNNENEIIKKICGDKKLTDIGRKIIIALANAGTNGISTTELQQKLGYDATAKTGAVGTAIYQLRKTFGANFIKNTNGKYKL
ncbi:MAG: hypothetical protein LBL75_02725 [Rickettsiales bacterium]|jgi:hypothetical protein|nr:hypothetical protein [Rickettsiales bacterium]